MLSLQLYMDINIFTSDLTNVLMNQKDDLESVLKEATEVFEDRNYQSDVVNICMAATADVLNINLHFYPQQRRQHSNNLQEEWLFRWLLVQKR